MEDMKANELMIGDKVMVKVLSQIPDTYVLHTWTANDYSRDIQVKPITLTPEILEKNGFVQEDDADMDAIAYKCFCEILTGHYSANDIIVSYDGSKEFTITNDLGYPCDEITLYRPKVHELQHALRLCGLNELADNFKV